MLYLKALGVTAMIIITFLAWVYFSAVSYAISYEITHNPVLATAAAVIAIVAPPLLVWVVHEMEKETHI